VGRWPWTLVLAAGLALGVAAEWTAYAGDPAATAADAAVGIGLLASGQLARAGRKQSRVGAVLTASGFAWFLGTFGGWLLYLHRGVLAHLILSFPEGRLPSRAGRAQVIAGYGYAAIYPVANSAYATFGFAAGLVVAAAHRYMVTRGPERAARLSALVAAIGFGAVLSLSAATQLADAGADSALLWLYDVTILLIGVGLAVDLVRERWVPTTVAGLVIDLGDPGSAGTLGERLVRALGDPTLRIAYFVPETGGYADDAGRPVELPGTDAGRAVTMIEDEGRQVAALVHDPAVLDDPALVRGAASATRLVVSNVRLQAEIRARVAEVAASRRRIVQAADAQRRGLERELREGPGRRLAQIAAMLDECGPAAAGARAELDEARSAVRELARGIHPAALTDRGLANALTELAARVRLPVTVSAPPRRWQPNVEAAAYFLCAEALTNVAKYAGASRATVSVMERDGRLWVSVADDGVGGADPSLGSGLRGLADRVEALGGELRVTSQPGAGTDVAAEMPLR
jgi:signal transduction histidine kinase